MKYFLDTNNFKKFDIMYGEEIENHEGEIKAKGILYQFNTTLVKPKLLYKDIIRTFYMSFDTFDEVYDYINIELEIRKQHALDSLNDSKFMFENDISMNRYDYMHEFEKILDKVKITKEDYKHIEILRDISINVGSFEYSSDFYIKFNKYTMDITNNKEEKYKFRYGDWKLSHIDELYNYLKHDLKISFEVDE